MPCIVRWPRLRLRQNNVPPPRERSRTLTNVTDSNVNVGWQARTCEVSARIAIEEGDLIRAEAEIGAALKLIRERDVPLVAWRVHASCICFAQENGSSGICQ
jgi:hypothetical protein